MQWFNEMKKSISQNLEEWKDTVCDWMRDKYNTKVTVQECAYHILHHPTTKKERIEYLGLVFHHYQLVENNFTYRLETKGEHDEQIVELKIVEDGQVIYAYYYYQANAELTQTIHLPENSSLTIADNPVVH